MAHLNRAMLRAFFLSAEPLLRDAESEVHVSLKLKFPYTSWDAKESAEAAGLLLHDRLEFDAGSFRGYVHRTTRADATTAGVKDRDKRHCKTFVFRRNPDVSAPVLCAWRVPQPGCVVANVAEGVSAVPACDRGCIVAEHGTRIRRVGQHTSRELAHHGIA